MDIERKPPKMYLTKQNTKNIKKHFLLMLPESKYADEDLDGGATYFVDATQPPFFWVILNLW